MDQGNLWDLQSMKPANSAAKLQRLGEFVDNMDVEDVYDPYGVCSYLNMKFVMPNTINSDLCNLPNFGRKISKHFRTRST